MVRGGTAGLAKRIYDRAHLTGEFRLRSGATSSEYFDKYLLESDPALLRDIAQAMVTLMPGDVEVVAGLELGGVPLATVVSQLSGLPTAFVRKRAKDYGTRRLAEGAPVAGRRVVVVEDVITSGGQVIESCAELRAAGADVVAVVCVIDREAGGRQNLHEVGLTLRAAFTMTALEQAAGVTGAG